MKTNHPHPLKAAKMITFWLPMEKGSKLQLGDDCILSFPEECRLPVFLWGDDYEYYCETEKVTITAHTILMGILLGYDTMLGKHEKGRQFLEETAFKLVRDVFMKDNAGEFLSNVAHWLRAEVGLAQGRTAMKTAMKLVPLETAAKIDFVSMSWYLAEDEDDDQVLATLLSELVECYKEMDPSCYPKDLFDKASYMFCASLGILGRVSEPGEQEWYEQGVKHINFAYPLEMLEQCMREGFSMYACRISRGTTH